MMSLSRRKARQTFGCAILHGLRSDPLRFFVQARDHPIDQFVVVEWFLQEVDSSLPYLRDDELTGIVRGRRGSAAATSRTGGRYQVPSWYNFWFPTIYVAGAQNAC